MTDEEKAAAAKAAADKKATEEAAKKTEEKKDDEGGEEEDDEEEQGSAEVKKLKAENAKRRIENKKASEEREALKAENARLKAALTGEKEVKVDPVEELKKETDRKLRNALLKGAVASVAKDAFDSSLLLSVAPGLFKDVEVDVENESVDEEQLSEALTTLRKSKPFLFETPESGKPTEKGKPVKRPPENGKPANGDNHLAQWRQLQSSNAKGDASDYYVKHNKEIKEQLKLEK